LFEHCAYAVCAPLATFSAALACVGCRLSVLDDLDRDSLATFDAGVQGDPDGGSDVDGMAGRRDGAVDGGGQRDGATRDGAAVCDLPSIDPTYRRVFLLSEGIPGPLGTLENMDGRCQLAADRACLGGQWMAWLSDTTRSPASRFEHATVPYRLLDGTRLADDWTDLTDGTLEHNIELTELGTTLEVAAWTATDWAGRPFVNLTCHNWQTVDSTVYAKTGISWSALEQWTWDTNNPCSSTLHLYCFEQQR
jgi:hypothetical protein